VRRCGQTRRRDTAERDIVVALRAVGALVVSVSGHDAPDLFVRYRGVWTALEVKTGKGRASVGQTAAGYAIVRSVAEAFQACGLPKILSR
jgi:hypothetical protein